MRIPLILPCLLLALLPGCQQPAPPFLEEAEKKIILETIEKETRSFFTNDLETWRSCYIHSGETSSSWNNADGTFDIFRGFTTLESYTRQSMDANAADTLPVAPLKLEYRNVKVKFFTPEVALVQYNQYISDRKGENYHQTLDERIMQKDSGQWKILQIVSLWNYKDKLPIDSLK